MNTVLESALLWYRQRSRLPQTFVFFVTSRCNARCPFCLYGRQVQDPVPESLELTVDEVERIARAYGRLHYLALSGGEPFIRKDLRRLCQAFIDHCRPAVIDIPSNFYYTDSMLDALTPLVAENPGVMFDLQLSIDHVGERHDELRKVAGLYETALKTFLALSELRRHHRNLRLKVNIVYLKENRDDLARIVAELGARLDPDRITLSYPQMLMPAAGGAGPAAAADARAYQEAARLVARGQPRRRFPGLYTLGMRAAVELYQELLPRYMEQGKNLGRFCEAGRRMIVLDEKGDVFPCEPLWTPIGNVRDHEYDIGKVLAGSAYREFRRDKLGAGKCDCTWCYALLSNISTRPRFLPSLGLGVGKALWSEMSRKDG